MKICIPTETDAGKKAKVYGHFGSAPYFTIYDTEKDDCETVDNSNQHHIHGTCHPVGALDSQRIDAVVCAGMGARRTEA
jgi:predicted Fe-Mo cluster-binding NifX family protein